MDLYKEPRLAHLHKWLEEGHSFLFEELWDGPKALLIALAQRATQKNIVVVSSSPHLSQDIHYFSGVQPLEFPAWEVQPQEHLSPSSDVMGERFSALKELHHNPLSRIVITTLPALLQKVISPSLLERRELLFEVKKHLPFDALPDLLDELGYQRRGVVTEKGEFALRGGIIDLFPISSQEPFRIEFFEDEIVSIRSFDPLSQLSQQKVDRVLVLPGNEIKMLEEGSFSLFDYVGLDSLIVFDDLYMIEEKYLFFHSNPSQHIFPLQEILDLTLPMQKLFFTQNPLEELSEVAFLEKGSAYSASQLPPKLSFSWLNHTFETRRLLHPFVPLFPGFCPRDIEIDAFTPAHFMHTLQSFPLTVTFLVSNDSEEATIEKELEVERKAEISFARGYLSSGFYLKELNFALVPTPELTGRYRIKREKLRSHYHAQVHDVFSFAPGESVVHMDMGIGRFLGLEKRVNHLGVETEYMLVEYAEHSKLYVPLEQASLISKYIGPHDKPPELDTLGSSRWKKVREKTERAILDYAQDLLLLQAEREAKEGFAYPIEGALLKQFEEEFPYEETPDQREAILKVYGDMQSKRPMDRLVLGDVGYGKTEVAMRASFKAVADGNKQVAILVPTTVLAMQHYENFTARMGGFGIRIAALSRFRNAKEIETTLKALEEGKVDIVIGTHRLISSDVAFKDLGLIVIDEEQRFGVKAKEHLKKMKRDVDLLTLSATPIPRTLYFSLVGARDMSVINTPPQDRLPIESSVVERSEELIKNVLIRELSRDGQAYFIHNRVETIYEVADKIRTLVPGAKVVVGHGQMSADELDLVFHAFKSGQAEILVATSIIENGIDIPNANTILIDHADRFGLADLYQMRGRVGRWNKKAYCYFMVSHLRDLNALARKRLAAITEASGYGGGMKIAMRDLEIRGAGNILGTEQSGHVASIGFHLYCKLLKKTISALHKKEKPLFLGSQLKVELPIAANIPEEYVKESTLRMEFYQRLGECETEGEIDTLFAEIKDRFGPHPKEVIWLYHLTKLRLFASKHNFIHIKLSKNLLHMVQEVDKKKTIERKIVFHPPTTPEEMIARLKETLIAHFPYING